MGQSLSRAIQIYLIVLAIFIPATSAQARENRPFYIGFTNFPNDISVQAVSSVDAFIAAEADLLTYHFDSGVPWNEALDGTGPYPDGLIEEITLLVQRRTASMPGHKLYVSATPQSQKRAEELALYWNNDTSQALPEPWASRSLDHPDVIAAFLNWCRFLIDTFNPDYFAYAIEANGGFASRQSAGFIQFETLAVQVYQTLKSEYPTLPIFLTLQTGSTEATRPNFLDIADRLLDISDYVAISSYPYLVLKLGGVDAYGDPANIPANLLSDLVTLAPGKPVAISETGYIAENLSLPGVGVTQPGSSSWQADYVQKLFSELQRYDTQFVVWFVSRDYDQMETTLENLGVALPAGFHIWRDTGLLAGNGTPREGLAVWRSWFALFDGDRDGMTDSYELDNGLQPDVSDASLDPDNDGLSNLAEFENYTRADNADTDGDGTDDFIEVQRGTDPNFNPAPVLLIILDMLEP